MLVFSTIVVLYPYLWFNSPAPLPCVNKYTVYTYTVQGEGYGGSGSQVEKHQPQSSFTG
jgi:hypothetical protein